MLTISFLGGKNPITWDVGDPKPIIGRYDVIYQAILDASRLSDKTRIYLIDRFRNVPLHTGNTIVWSGDFADFIVNNLMDEDNGNDTN